MGKCKKKKSGESYRSPIGFQSVSETEFELTTNADVVPGALQDIIEKLQSPYEEARECGCVTVAGFVSEPGAVGQLMKHHVVKILAPLVLDSCLGVRLKSLGALRNISVDGSPSVCKQMVQQDVMTPLVAFLHQVGRGEDFPEEVRVKQRDLVTEIYTQAVHLLLNLCESSSQAVTVFNKENLWLVLSPFLISPDCENSLKVAVAQCLYTVTEDNHDLSALGLQDTVKQCVGTPGNTSQHILLRALAWGILVNMESNKFLTEHGNLVVTMVTVLAEVFALDVMSLLIPDQSEPPKLNQDKLTEIENLLSAQKVALEIVANICCSDNDSWEDMSDSESGCDDVINDVTEEPMEASSNGEMSPCVEVPIELHAAFVQCGILQKVLSLAEPLTEEQARLVNVLPSGTNLAERFASRQIHALLCLNNLFGSLDTAAFKDEAGKLDLVWQRLITLSKEKNCVENQELLEAVTSAMRALMQNLTQADPSRFADISEAELQYMFEMAMKCTWCDVRVNAIRIVSTVGTVLAKFTEPHPLLKNLGLFLLEIVCNDTDLWVVAEALDSIFDVFGEDHLDPVVREIEMVEKLKLVLPALKARMQSQKKNLGEHYPVISTARTNLVRFIKYKSK